MLARHYITVSSASSAISATLGTTPNHSCIVGHILVVVAALAFWALAAENLALTVSHTVVGCQTFRTQAVVQFEFLKHEVEERVQATWQLLEQHLTAFLLKYGAAIHLARALLGGVRFVKAARGHWHRLRQRLLAWRHKGQAV